MATNYIRKIKSTQSSRPGAKAGRALSYASWTLIIFAIASLVPTAMIFVDVPVDLIDHTLAVAAASGGLAALLLLARTRKMPKFMKKFMEKSVQIAIILAIIAITCIGLHVTTYSVPFMAWYTFG